MLANLKEIYSSSLSNFTLSVKPSSFFFKFHVLNECRIRSKHMNKWEGIKPRCVPAPPPVHDVIQCFLFFNGGVAHLHTSLELYLTFIQR